MENEETENILPFLTAETVTRTIQLDGDTREDIIRLRQFRRQMQDIDDDLQSQVDQGSDSTKRTRRKT
eukprot:3595686-Amphidinium_carterae.2